MADPEEPTLRLAQPPLWKGYASLVIYHAIFCVLVVVCAPVLAWRMTFNRRYRDGFLGRNGRVEPTMSNRRIVWIHGVSVGEIKAASTFVAAIEQHHPELEIVVSATTPTGYDFAKQLYAGHRIIRFPLDIGHFPGRALDRVRPDSVFLMELEIWPNFLQAAARRGIPVAVINGRISDASFRGYRRVRWLLPQLDWIAHYCVQNAIYRNRLTALGIAEDQITITGNMKYDTVLLWQESAEIAPLRAWLSPDGRPVVVCGSTHGPEEEWLTRTVRKVSTTIGRSIRLVLVPRHPERAASVAEGVQSLGLNIVRWTRLDGLESPLGDDDVVLVDTIGQLEPFYAACDLAFVGGSLVRHGGQNMLEPAAMGRAVLFGPHTTNFRRDVELLLGARGAIQVDGVAQLETAIAGLLVDPDERRGYGERAVELIRENRGATDRTHQLLERLLIDPEPVPITPSRGRGSA